MPDEKIPELRDIDWGMSDDGRSIELLFKAHSGEQIVSRMTDESLFRFLTRLIDLGVRSGEKAAPDKVETRRIRAEPIPVSQMGVGPGREPTEVNLLLRTGMLEMLFAVDAGLLLEALRMLESLSWPMDKPRPS